MTRIHPISPGFYCVPSAIQAITGAEPYSVILPAIHRHRDDGFLFGEIAGVRVTIMESVLNELGYAVRPAREKARHQLRWWAQQSLERKWPHPLLVTNRGHAMVVFEGRVYDTLRPHGELADSHPEAKTVINNASLVVKR